MNRYRSFGLILYPDSESYDYQEILNIAKETFNEYAYIVHDEDIDENGEFKKVHTHFYGRFTNPRTPEQVANHFKGSISVNQIEIVHSFKGVVKYLVHANEPDKHQYDPTDICTNITGLADKYLGVCESIQVLKMINYRKDGATIKDLIYFAKDHDCYAVLRRNIGIITYAAKEEIDREHCRFNPSDSYKDITK